MNRETFNYYLIDTSVDKMQHLYQVDVQRTTRTIYLFMLRLSIYDIFQIENISNIEYIIDFMKVLEENI